MVVFLEPWGHQVLLERGDSLSLRLDSETEGEADVLFAEGSLTVFAWSGCRLRFEVNGVPQVDYPPCP